MDYIKSLFLKYGGSFQNGTYSKPATCPYCGYGTDAPVMSRVLFIWAALFICLQVLANVHIAIKPSSLPAIETFLKHQTLLAHSVSQKTVSPPYKNDVLSQISKRFIQMYNQALNAEFNNSLDLAAIGYRSSLEILVKDFAISELGVSEDEASKKSLCDAIGTYLMQEDLVKTADVVRILGNDYAHFKRKYPDFDFNLLKYYMDIFMKQIEAQYMIHHPPLERQQD